MKHLLKSSFAAVSLATALVVGIAAPLAAQDSPIYSLKDRFQPETAQNGMVASQEAVASRVGVDILKKGGNAVDAAIATGFALAVTLPRAGNLGGGGFMMIHLADSGDTKALDYREMAPAAAFKDMFLGEDGEPDNQKSRFSGLAVGVPGTVAGFAEAFEKHGSGKLTWAELVAPAIGLAENGIEVTPDLAASLTASAKRLLQDPATAAIFYKTGGMPFVPGETLKQTDLAATLKLIADKGAAGFYTGEVAEKIAQKVTASGGGMTTEDMAGYKPVWRDPVVGSYHGYEIASMPPPSSGGVHIVQILNMLQGYPLAEYGPNSADSIHVMAETMRRAYADRSKYLGDPDFVDVPVKGLTDPAYAAELVKSIKMDMATPSEEMKPGDPFPYESNQTTHYSVVDKDGNAVSNTYTLNFSYGVGLTADGTGVLLNNELDDFSAKPGVPNAYGLLGADANAIAPGKRMLSSMTPTIVTRDGEPWLVTGSPGGSTIITTTMQVILNSIDHQMSVNDAVGRPRFHHQWQPDQVWFEPLGLSPDTLSILRDMGHEMVSTPWGGDIGDANSIKRVDGEMRAMSDPRNDGGAAAF